MKQVELFLLKIHMLFTKNKCTTTQFSLVFQWSRCPSYYIHDSNPKSLISLSSCSCVRRKPIKSAEVNCNVLLQLSVTILKMLWYSKISFSANKLLFCLIYTSKYYQSNFTKQPRSLWQKKFGKLFCWVRYPCL